MELWDFTNLFFFVCIDSDSVSAGVPSGFFFFLFSSSALPLGALRAT